MKNKIIIVGIIVVVVIASIAGIIYKRSYQSAGQVSVSDQQQTSTADRIDIVLDFYNQWLDAAKSTSTDPYKLGLADNPLLSKSLKDALTVTQGHSPADIDPVLCQSTKPEKVSARMVSEATDMARVLIMSKDKTQTAQSVFTLKSLNGGWYIDSILCAPGEFEAPREFTFDKEGYILKQSIPKPYDPKNWHVVFEDNGQKGHVAPLFFKPDTSCTAEDGTIAVCTPEQFIQASKVHIYGQMTELGVEVKKMEFVK